MVKMKETGFSSKGAEDLYNIVRSIAPRLSYHNLPHILDVANSSKRYAKLEGLGNDAVFVLESASLLHDIIYIKGRNDNEEKSVERSKEILTVLDYSQEEINEISRLILATKFPTNPKDILEMIICDSDLDHLGRNDFFEKSELLRIEFGVKKNEWYTKVQPAFLANVKFYTSSAQKLRNNGVKENCEKLKNWRSYVK